MNTYQSRITLNTESGKLKIILQIRSPYHIQGMSLQSLDYLLRVVGTVSARLQEGAAAAHLQELGQVSVRQTVAENINFMFKNIFMPVIIPQFNKIPGGVSGKLIVTEWVIEAIGIRRGRGAFIVVIFDTRD